MFSHKRCNIKRNTLLPWANNAFMNIFIIQLWIFCLKMLLKKTLVLICANIYQTYPMYIFIVNIYLSRLINEIHSCWIFMNWYCAVSSCTDMKMLKQFLWEFYALHNTCFLYRCMWNSTKLNEILKILFVLYLVYI